MTPSTHPFAAPYKFSRDWVPIRAVEGPIAWQTAVRTVLRYGAAPKRDPADPQDKWLIYLRYISFGRGPDRRRSGPLLKRIVIQKSVA